MSKYAPAGGGTYNLGSSIGSTDTTILLSSFIEPVSATPYTMVLLNTDIVYGTIAPRTSSSEFISFTGITQNADGTATLTGVTRGLAKKYPFTGSATFRLPHSGQSIFILSDAPQVFNKYLTLENAEIITGLKTFPGGGNASAPVSGTVYAAPTNDLEYASKKYVDGVAIAGAPDATLTVKGIVEIATTAEINSGSPTGSTGASVAVRPDQLTASIYGLQLPSSIEKAALVGNNGSPSSTNKYVAQSGFQAGSEVYGADSVGTDAYAITVSPAVSGYTAGQRFFVKIGTANTGAATLAVGSGAAKAIKKNYNSDLVTGDLVAGQIIGVIYDSANDVWQLATPTNTSIVISKTVTTTYDLTTASGAQTIAHGLGVTPKYIRLTIMLSLSGGTANSIGAYDGTTQTYVYDGQSTQPLSAAGNGTGKIAHVIGESGAAFDTKYQEAVASFDSTNVTLTWTRTSTPSGTARIVLEAFV